MQRAFVGCQVCVWGAWGPLLPAPSPRTAKSTLFAKCAAMLHMCCWRLWWGHVLQWEGGLPGPPLLHIHSTSCLAPLGLAALSVFGGGDAAAEPISPTGACMRAAVYALCLHACMHALSGQMLGTHQLVLRQRQGHHKSD